MPDESPAPNEQKPDALVVVEPAPALDLVVVQEQATNAALAYIATLSENSRPTGIACIKRVLTMLAIDPEEWSIQPWGKMGTGAIIRVRDGLIKRYGVTTARSTMSTLRSVLRMAFVLGQVSQERFARITSWRPIQGESPPRGRALTPSEIRRLRAHCETLAPAPGASGWGILACALGGGLRREEIAKLRVTDVSDDVKHLRVRGKGAREIMQPIPAWVGGALEAWLAQRNPELTTEALFVPLRTKKVQDHPMTRWQVWELLRDLGDAAGVKAFTPHDLRRTYCTTYLEATGDIAMAAHLMRHKSPATTMRYDKRNEKAAEKAVDVFAEQWGLNDDDKR